MAGSLLGLRALVGVGYLDPAWTIKGVSARLNVKELVTQLPAVLLRTEPPEPLTCWSGSMELLFRGGGRGTERSTASEAAWKEALLEASSRMELDECVRFIGSVTLNPALYVCTDAPVGT
jgi:hypothetical protein